MELTLVIPALNEAGNIGELVRRAHTELDGLGIQYEILVIDGDSTDNTVGEASAAGARVVLHPVRGYGGALRQGFAHAQGDVIITMDSDLSHEPEFLRELWLARERADIVIASRYVSGGKADMSGFRYFLSRILNSVYTLLLRIPVRDISSGFRLYRHSALDEIEIVAKDFDALEEILIKLYVRKHKVLEVPFHYKPRKEGKSHAKLVRFAWAYLITLVKMFRLRLNGKK